MKSKKILPLVLMLSTVALGSCGGKSSSTPISTPSSTPSSATTTTKKDTTTTPKPFIDTREFMLAGEGNGAELELKWEWKFEEGVAVPTEHIKLVQQAGQNVYKLTVNLYEGDEFKIVSTKGWDDGNISFAQLQNAGANFEDNSGNIKVKVSATYELTLTTTENDTANVLSYTKVNDLTMPKITYSYLLKGSWGDPAWEDKTPFVQDETTTTLFKLDYFVFGTNDEFGVEVRKHVGEKNVEVGFLNFNNVTEGTVGFEKAASSDNIVCNRGGAYIITYDSTTEKLTFTSKY